MTLIARDFMQSSGQEGSFCVVDSVYGFVDSSVSTERSDVFGK